MTYFADTAFWIALLLARDQYHAQAVAWRSYLARSKANVVTSQAVLWELLNALGSPSSRGAAAHFYSDALRSPELEVIELSPEQIEEAVQLYVRHGDKEWSLTDCHSFALMRRRNLTQALTADHHYAQAGYPALLLQPPPQG